MRKEFFMKKQKSLIKLSNMLLDALKELQLVRLYNIRSSLENFSYKCSEATKDSHLFYAAVERGWLCSAEKIRTRANRNLTDFSYQLQSFKGLIDSGQVKLPNLSCIYAEFEQLELDLGQFRFDINEKSISVVTDPVTLKDIPLGPFEIKLFIDQICNIYTDSPYRIIALNPNPAGSNDSVTHPHVSDERLCEGDAVVTIRKSIEQGRICDFFMIIVNILQTYNPDSPYVSLDDWQGVCCYDCGRTEAEDESYYCEFCDRDYCAHCSTYCQICDITICLGCAFECPSCGKPVCIECTTSCRDCEEVLCKDCLNEECLCSSCQEQRKENSDEEINSTTGTQVQPYSMG